MLENTRLSVLRLRITKQEEIDLSDSPAIVTVTESESGHWEWFVAVQTNRIFDPNISSYQAEMVTDDGQLLNGIVFTPYANSTSGLDGGIVLEGMGPLNGYDLPK